MIRVERQGRVATVLLDRTDARNAVSIAGWHALASTFADLAQDDAQTVVVASAVPGIFSAGADLSDLARLVDHPDERPAFRAAMRAAIDGLAALPMPSVAAIAGGCHGAAVALALAADLRVATPAARFAIPPARLGISYPAEDVGRLMARVGPGQAARLLYTANPIDAVEAHRIGLVEIVANDPRTVVDDIAANDAGALRALKAILHAPAAPEHVARFDAAFDNPTLAAGLARFRAR